jgi:NiFe hydrogenase small subunit HydA
MYSPSAEPWVDSQTLGEHLAQRGIDRRDFLAFCAQMSAILGLGTVAAPRVAKALTQQKKPSVIWLQLQECTGCVESVLRTASPTIGDLVLDLVSLDYQHTIMAAAGHQSEKALRDSMERNKGSYLLVCTGSVPLNDDGIYCWMCRCKPVGGMRRQIPSSINSER